MQKEKEKKENCARNRRRVVFQLKGSRTQNCSHAQRAFLPPPEERKGVVWPAVYLLLLLSTSCLVSLLVREQWF